jgi:hypothetical protein
MEHSPNSTSQRTFCLAFVSAFLFVLAFMPTAPAVAADANDKVVIASEDSLSPADMGSSRGSGGTFNITTVTSNQTMESTSTGNTLNVGGSLTNGPIFVGENFGGNGFGSYVMNTGNNSVINSGVSLSVLMMQQ